MTTQDIICWTDGSCRGTVGAWACIMTLVSPEGEIKATKEYSGQVLDTTNNRQELTAVIECLKALKCEPGQYHITVYTDSEYIQKGITEWIPKWLRNNWRTSDRKPVKNQDLWEEYLKLYEKFKPQIVWVRGHATNAMNNRVDALATAALNM